MNIKTMHFTNAYHPTSGGIRTFYHQLLAAAQTYQRHVRLVVPADATRIEEISPYARVYHIAAPRSPFFDSRYRVLLPHSWMIPFQSTIRKIIVEEQPDLVEVADKYSLCYLGGFLRKCWIKGAKRPAVVGISCERMDDNVAAFITSHPVGHHFADWYMKNVFTSMFDSFIAVSEYTAGEFKNSANCKGKPVYIASMGVDAKTFHPRHHDSDLREHLLKKAGGSSRSVALLYAGRLSHEKNVGLLLDTLEQLQQIRAIDYRLIIAGSGPMAGWIEKETARRVPGRVFVIEHIKDRNYLSKLYASLDIFLHPNPKEPFGIAPLEAMASGIPVLVPNSGGVISYANESNAWLAEANGASFAQAVQQIVINPVERQSRINQARLTAEELDWDNALQKFFMLYDTIVLAGHCDTNPRGDPPEVSS